MGLVLLEQIKKICSTLAPKNHQHSATDISSGSLPVECGGTGATTASDARTNLGVLSKTGDTLNGDYSFDCTSNERKLQFTNVGANKNKWQFYARESTSTKDDVFGLYDAVQGIVAFTFDKLSNMHVNTKANFNQALYANNNIFRQSNPVYGTVSIGTISIGSLAANEGKYVEITYDRTATNPYPIAIAKGVGDNINVTYANITTTTCGFWVKTIGAAATDVALKYMVFDIDDVFTEDIM